MLTFELVGGMYGFQEVQEDIKCLPRKFNLLYIFFLKVSFKHGFHHR